MAILDCGHEPIPHSKITNGYGTDTNGKRHCFGCIAEMDKATMVKEGNSRKLPLYLVGNEVTNWPGSLRFPVSYKKTGYHNVASKRYDVWFKGPDGYQWHGVQYGDMTQIVHCKRGKVSHG